MGSAEVEPIFIRGDGNADGLVDLSDAVYILSYLFLGNDEPTCPASADANASDALDVSDATFILNFRFVDGTAPAPPFPGCGTNLEHLGELECESFAPCNERLALNDE